ncbi:MULTISPECIES: ATP/GTP-binding protein [Streptomyces]|uniref:ATP/GTP-binding protein n=1 Tax=Streptomyces TaxID=1883 RepID=UPI00163C1782|nr:MULTISPECIES: ATP/GTP-binding protein [Streptomyces]MBC2879695.1 ATP/GTP-binding protein [Streptomyces sp. TYQ1024]UBI36504.1 ATP/GTP-binding protein [Streptomyces mobaraensis]UKW29095.1 ATP/GTP-binding protein [Streptomyces sp. TYQ1024]
MATEDTYGDAYGAPPFHGGRAARPVPPAPRRPPAPGVQDEAEHPFLAWLRTPRPAAQPGVWRFGHRPKPPEEPGRTPGRQLLGGAVISMLCGWLVWSLLWHGYFGPYWKWPLKALVPGDWDEMSREWMLSSYVYYALWFCGLVVLFARIGRVPELWRRHGRPAWSSLKRRTGLRLPPALLPERPDRIPRPLLVRRAALALAGAVVAWELCYDVFGEIWLWPLMRVIPVSWMQPPMFFYASYAYYTLFIALFLTLAARFGCWGELWRRYTAPDRPPRLPGGPAGTVAPAPDEDPADWPRLRAEGAPDAAERLAADARRGLMNDVDRARIERAWEAVRNRPEWRPAFTDAVLRAGAAACAHPSGARDLPVRAARHDLVTGQVRIGTAAEDHRNPYDHRGVGWALEPGLLGTSLLAVGPPGCGKTAGLVRPVLESLCLQALAGRAAVVAVGAAGTALAPDEAFDVVIRIGRPDSAYDLDLYGGTEDPDEAAAILAEGLVGDLAAALPGGDGRRAATALAQILGPYHGAHGRFPSVQELRELLDGSPAALDALRDRLAATGQEALARELDARERQARRPGDPAPMLADRVALLDRPAFAGFFDTGDPKRTFSLRTLEHPLRVRIDLPERGHAEASRMLARLILAQFTESAAARADRSLFACLVLDDATHTVTAESVRGLQRLRSAHAGAVLTLRTLDDVPEALRSALLGTVGCRMAFSGVTTWDGARFAEVWGKEWVETRDVTDRQIIAHEPLTRALHVLRRVVTGRAVTAQSVTVRTVERERWSASELAHGVPPGHAVLSVTSVRGVMTPPVLVNLRD